MDLHRCHLSPTHTDSHHPSGGIGDYTDMVPSLHNGQRRCLHPSLRVHRICSEANLDVDTDMTGH